MDAHNNIHPNPTGGDKLELDVGVSLSLVTDLLKGLENYRPGQGPERSSFSEAMLDSYADFLSAAGNAIASTTHRARTLTDTMQHLGDFSGRTIRAIDELDRATAETLNRLLNS